MRILASFILVLCLSSMVWGAAGDVTLPIGDHPFGPVAVGKNDGRVLIGFNRDAWPVNAVVKIDIFLTTDGARRETPICFFEAKGGSSLPGGNNESALDCPIPGLKAGTRMLDAMVSVKGAAVSTRFRAVLQ